MPHKTRADLEAALPTIRRAAAEGPLAAIVVRPEHGQRVMPQSADLSLAGGVAGDHWVRGCWRVTEDGAPHPDV